jgi:hypothetical protein
VTIANFVDDLMSGVLTGISGNVVKLAEPDDVNMECPENFNLLSNCFAAVVFNEIDISERLLVSVFKDVALMIELYPAERLWTSDDGCQESQER